jgi:hypothetical protein
LEEIRSSIGTAAYRDAVIELEQERISPSWWPDATTSRWKLRPDPGLRMFRLVQREWEESGMHLRDLWAKRPEIAGGNVHHVQAVSSRFTRLAARPRKALFLLHVLLQRLGRKRPLSP